jgi:hypothetical protein
MMIDCMNIQRLLPLLLILLGLNVACSQNERAGANNGSAKREMTEQEKVEKDTALRNETEAKMMKGEYLHDGALTLEYVGDIESVPALLVVLEEYPADSHGGMACPGAHALDALKKITGANPGFTHRAWSDWWKNYKKQNKITSRLEKD